MKPTTLRPGDCIRRKDNASAPVLTFVERNKITRISYLRADEYVGQYGPGDIGHVLIHDASMARDYVEVPQ